MFQLFGKNKYAILYKIKTIIQLLLIYFQKLYTSQLINLYQNLFKDYLFFSNKKLKNNFFYIKV